MALTLQKSYAQDVTQPIKVRNGGELVFTGNADVDTISVALYNGGAEYEPGGSVTLNCIRADGVTMVVSGAVSGNVASATLTQACCAVPGMMTVVMQLTSGGTGAIFAAVYNVLPSSTDTVGDAGTIIADVAALIANIEAAVATIPTDYSALLASIAPTFSASTAYAAGDYVWYNAVLYRFTADHAAGAWTGTDATAVVVGNEISELKSAVGDLDDLHTDEKTNVVGAINEINDRFPDGIEAAVSAWLDEHPEATTTVEDHSLTYKKLVNGTLGFVTPEMFGAKGDGSKDDSLAFLDMVNFVNENDTPIYLEKVYYITTSLVLTNYNVRIFGGGTIKRVVASYHSGTNNILLYCHGYKTLYINNVKFKNSITDKSAVAETDTRYYTVFCQPSADNEYSIIENCEFDNDIGNPIFTTTSLKPYYGCVAFGEVGRIIYNVTIKNNKIYGGSGRVVYLRTVHNFVIANNYIETKEYENYDNYSTVMMIRLLSCKNGDVYGNEIINNTENVNQVNRALYIDTNDDVEGIKTPCDNIRIHDNNLKCFSANATVLYLASAKDIILHDNIIDSSKCFVCDNHSQGAICAYTIEHNICINPNRTQLLSLYSFSDFDSSSYIKFINNTFVVDQKMANIYTSIDEIPDRITIYGNTQLVNGVEYNIGLPDEIDKTVTRQSIVYTGPVTYTITGPTNKQFACFVSILGADKTRLFAGVLSSYGVGSTRNNLQSFYAQSTAWAVTYGDDLQGAMITGNGIPAAAKTRCTIIPISGECSVSSSAVST